MRRVFTTPNMRWWLLYLAVGKLPAAHAGVLGQRYLDLGFKPGGRGVHAARGAMVQSSVVRRGLDIGAILLIVVCAVVICACCAEQERRDRIQLVVAYQPQCVRRNRRKEAHEQRRREAEEAAVRAEPVDDGKGKKKEKEERGEGGRARASPQVNVAALVVTVPAEHVPVTPGAGKECAQQQEHPERGGAGAAARRLT
eukprot:gene37798-44686_t